MKYKVLPFIYFLSLLGVLLFYSSAFATLSRDDIDIYVTKGNWWDTNGNGYFVDTTDISLGETAHLIHYVSTDSDSEDVTIIDNINNNSISLGLSSSSSSLYYEYEFQNIPNNTRLSISDKFYFEDSSNYDADDRIELIDDKARVIKGKGIWVALKVELTCNTGYEPNDDNAACVPSVQDVDIVAINKKDSALNIFTDGAIDTDFEIGVAGCYNNNYGKECSNSGDSQHLEGKDVKFSVSYDNAYLQLKTTNEETILHNGDDAYSGWNCLEDTTTTTITCTSSSHGALNDGITTSGLLNEFDFTPVSGATGDSNIVFKTWTTSDDISDDGSYNDGIFLDSSNNVQTISVSVSEIATDLEVEIYNTTDKETEITSITPSILDGVFTVEPRIKNISSYTAENYGSDKLQLVVNYNPEYLSYRSSATSSFHRDRSNDGTITFTLKDNRSINTGESEDISLSFNILKFTNGNVADMISYSIVDFNGSDSNDSNTTDVNINPVDFGFGTDKDDSIDWNENRSGNILISQLLPHGRSYNKEYVYSFCPGETYTNLELLDNDGHNTVARLQQKSAFDYEATNANNAIDLCVQAKKENVLIGEETLTVNISNVNEKPADDYGGVSLLVPYDTDTKTFSFDDLQIGDDDGDIDPDVGDENSTLTIFDISSTFSFSDTETSTISGTHGTLSITGTASNNSLTFTPNNGRTGTEIFYYKIKDDEGLFGIRKVEVTISDGSGCSTPSASHAETQTWYEGDFCIPVDSICNNGNWVSSTGDPLDSNKYYTTSSCTPLTIRVTLSDDGNGDYNNTTPAVASFNDDGSFNSGRFDVYNGEEITLTPTLSFDGTFPDNKIVHATLSVSFPTDKYQVGSAPSFTCTNNTNTTRCTQDIEIISGYESFELPLRVIGPGGYQGSENTDITYELDNFSIDGNPMDSITATNKELYFTANSQRLLDTIRELYNVPNELNNLITPLSTHTTFSNERNIDFEIARGGQCGVSDDEYLGVSQNNTLYITQLFNEESKTLCIKIIDMKDVDDTTDDVVLGYDSIEVFISTTGAFMILSNGAEENTSSIKLGDVLLEDRFNPNTLGVCNDPNYNGKYTDAIEILPPSTPVDDIYSEYSLNVSDFDLDLSDSDLNSAFEGLVSTNATIRNYISGLPTYEREEYKFIFAEKLADLKDNSSSRKIVQLKTGVSLNFEDGLITKIGDTNRYYEACLQVNYTDSEISNGEPVEQKFYIPVADVNDAPGSVSMPNGVQASVGMNTFSLSALGIKEGTDEDAGDGIYNDQGVSALSVNNIVLSSVYSDSYTWGNDPISSSGYTISPEGKSGITVRVDGTNSPGEDSVEIYYNLCDNGDGNNTNILCTAQELTIHFQAPSSCSANNYFTGETFEFALAQELAHGAEVPVDFYASENALDCGDEENEVQIKCFNGDFKYSTDNGNSFDNLENTTTGIYSSCADQCNGQTYNESNNTYNLVNSGEKDFFFLEPDAISCPASDIPDVPSSPNNYLELTCSDGSWYNGDTVAANKVDRPNRECFERCTYLDSSGNSFRKDTLEEISIYEFSNKDCSTSTKTLYCDNETWKDSDSTTWTQGSSPDYNWTSASAPSQTLYNSCTEIDYSCTLRYTNSSGSPESINIPLYASLIDNIPAGVSLPALYTQSAETDTKSCGDSRISASTISCGSSNTLFNSGSPLTDDLYETCSRSCSNPEGDHDSRMTLYKMSGADCIEVDAQCDNGYWKNSSTGLNIGSGFSTSTCSIQEDINSDATVSSVVLTADVDDVTETISNEVVDEDGAVEKTSPIASVDSAVEGRIRDKNIANYNKEKNEGGGKLIESPFHNGGADVALQVRVYLNDGDTDIIPDAYADLEDQKDAIVVRWKLVGKDSLGKPISLQPSFVYSDNPNEYGCGMQMICMDDFQASGSDDVGEFRSASISSLGFQGKIVTKSPLLEGYVNRLNENGFTTLKDFLTDETLAVTYPEIQVIYETPIGAGDGDASYRNILYKLELDDLDSFVDFALSDGRFKVTSQGAYGSYSQDIETVVDMPSILPSFEYVIFGQ